MNERIRELAEQCWDRRLYSWHFDQEMFAELIVRECIDIVSPYAVRMEDFDGGHPISDLKKHFGVD